MSFFAALILRVISIHVVHKKINFRLALKAIAAVFAVAMAVLVNSISTQGKLRTKRGRRFLRRAGAETA